MSISPFFTVITEGVLSCDGESCDDDCPIHAEPATEENE